MNRWAKIRFVVAAFVVGALLAGIWLVPSIASAENPAAVNGAVNGAKKYSEEDCQALRELDDEIPDVKSSSSDIFGKKAAAYSEGDAATAKKVKDKKLKKALTTLAGFYDDLSDVDNIADALATTVKGGKAYIKANATWAKAFSQCVVSQITIPSITLPSGVTLPSGITLPNNITLPSIPR